MRPVICFLSFLLMIFFAKTAAYAQNERSLRETFDFYVESVQNKQLEILFSIISDQPDFLFITAQGELIQTRKGYYTFHEQWFGDDQWEMPVELISVEEGDELGYTHAIFYYRTRLKDGRNYHLDSYFTLIYRKENGIWKVIGDVCSPVERYFTSDTANTKYSEKQEYLFETMHNRRTVRKYKSTPVPGNHIIRILDAARMCPTAGNQQPWKFLVVRNREKLDQLKKEANNWFMERYMENGPDDPREIDKIKSRAGTMISNALSAPVYVAVLVDKNTKYSDYIIHDGSLAAGYLMIAARSLGYGTGFFTSFFPGEKMKTFFNIPDHYQLICFTPIGVPEDWPETPGKKDMDEIIVWEEF